MSKYTIYAGPEGPLFLAVDDEGRVLRLHFVDGALPIESGWVQDDAALAEVTRQLDEYFAGDRVAFDLALAPRGTPFLLEVWDQLCRIPYGETISYGELATRVDRPGAARAVGAANGQNPIAIIVPCHRVIGKDGGLTGFAGGYEAKRYLLEIERAS